MYFYKKKMSCAHGQILIILCCSKADLEKLQMLDKAKEYVLVLQITFLLIIWPF